MEIDGYESVIGLEVHVQLSARTKAFCSSASSFSGEPNQYIDPVTLGLPGALPVCNEALVESAIKLGLATNCEIREISHFARKHYFYPDLPKGYQISQYDEPICERGSLTIHLAELGPDGKPKEIVGDKKRVIGIKRIHMEEDAGKNIHDSGTHSSLIDLNRAGVSLLEIVSEPDIRTPSEAAAYLRTLRQLVRFLGISDGNMEEGSLRCDANISLRPVGTLKFGTRTEIKNLNSFKFVERALEYEIARQLAVLKSGGKVVQETLTFDSATGATRTLRSKEEAADYRYFPDPDLPAVFVENRQIEKIRREMPKLPEQIMRELIELHGLTEYDATVLATERSVVDFYYQIYQTCGNARAACNWLASELFGLLNKEGLSLAESPVSAVNIGLLIKLLDSEAINGKMAKAVFEEMFNTGKSPEAIVAEKGLKQITSDEQIAKLIEEVFIKFPEQLGQYVSGNDKLHGFFVGETMKACQGSANPKKLNELIKAAVLKRRG
jgi:aspartyl-tRNA(Asn)/glutamyl-tRNA(Gln) amidotransferase subunit B